MLLMFLGLLLCACGSNQSGPAGTAGTTPATTPATENGVATEIRSDPESEAETQPETIAEARAIPGEKTVRNLLLTALEPVGSTMYVWGGGWNESDDGAGIEAVTIGVSPAWRAFYLKQDAAYDFDQTRYQIHDGLDCSGYVGWVVYNVMNTESGGKGYVTSSTSMADMLAGCGFGSSQPYGTVTDIQPGDIMSMKGHVWIAVGACPDGSCVLLHSSPAGVSLCGTKTPDGADESEAIRLAERYMAQEYPDWYSKFPNCKRDASYFTASRFRWNRQTLADPDGILAMNAEAVLKNLFSS